MTVPEKVAAANAKVIEIMTKGRPVWTDVLPALEAVPGMEPNLILVPGPPIEPKDLPIPLKTAVCGAACHDGLAKNVDEAWEMVLHGEIRIAPSQDYNCGNAASSVMSASMPVFVVEDKTNGGKGFCVPHPGSNPRVLRWGIYGEDVEENLRFIRGDYAAVLGEAVRNSGGIDLIRVLSKTAGMGDENHNRQPAASMALALELVPWLLDVDHPARDRVIKEIAANDRFFLHVWYTTKAPLISGIFLKPTTTEADLLGYLGDSCVTEVWGLGGMSAIAGPAYLRMTGGTFKDAKERTEKARQVSLGEHSFAPIPWDDYRGFPVGVDIRKVVGLNILPISHGGSALKTGGQAGAGAAELPVEVFKKAVVGMVEDVKRREGEAE